MTRPTSKNNNYEVNLIEFIVELWEEKIAIITITLLVSLLSIIYVFKATPIYSISAQITPPPETEINKYRLDQILGDFDQLPTPSTEGTHKPLDAKQKDSTIDVSTLNDKINPKDTFSIFLSILSSNSHISALAENNPKALKDAFGITIDDNTISNLNAIREISIPDTSKKINKLAPDSYILSISGLDREAMKTIIYQDLTLASKTTTREIQSSISLQLEQFISEQESLKKQKIKTIKNHINARKSYLAARKEGKINELNEAYNIAQALDIKNPTSISQLSVNNAKIELSAEFSNTPPPLYLRGTKLLAAELKELQNTPKALLTDDNLQLMKAQLVLLSSSPLIEQLKEQLESTNNREDDIRFFNPNFDMPTSPIKPQKIKIVAAGIFLGGLIGFLIATIRIVRRRFTNTFSEEGLL